MSKQDYRLTFLGDVPTRVPCYTSYTLCQGKTSVPFLVLYSTKEMLGSSIDAQCWWESLDQSSLLSTLSHPKGVHITCSMLNADLCNLQNN